MAKLKTIGLSFKNTDEDRKLYDWIYQHSNISGFIKDILRKEMKGNKNKEEVKKEVNDKEKLLDLGDF